MTTISFYCKLAAVLFCLSPNVANTDIVSYLEVILNKKKSQIFFLFDWNGGGHFQINTISKRIELE